MAGQTLRMVAACRSHQLFVQREGRSAPAPPSLCLSSLFRFAVLPFSGAPSSVVSSLLFFLPPRRCAAQVGSGVEVPRFGVCSEGRGSRRSAWCHGARPLASAAGKRASESPVVGRQTHEAPLKPGQVRISHADGVAVRSALQRGIFRWPWWWLGAATIAA